MLEIKNLSKFYSIGGEKFAALNNVTLTFQDGDFVAVKGTSGAGKSTLLHILGCLETFDKGEYLFNGINIAQLNDEKRAKLRNEKIGIVLQDFALINHQTVLFNVMLPLYFSKKSYFKMKKAAFEVLDLVGIKDQAKKKANQLSGGQRQRVAIARALINNPSVILADEPTGALDSKTTSQIMELFQQLNNRGITVIIVTHDNEVASYCNSTIEISDGEVLR